ncbi:MAG TPA: hypothetical protein VFZ98_00905, partial [Vicinamibacterales bacterium]
IVTLIAVLFGAAILVRDGGTTSGAVTAGVFSFFASVLGSAIVGGLIAWIASLRAPSAVWVAQPGPIIAAMWLLGGATAIIIAAPLHARAGFDGLFIGSALCWIAMSVTLSAVLPGGAYLALVPAIAFAICIVLRATLDLSPAASVIITSVVTAVLWFPVINAFYDLIGRQALGVIATAVALVATTFTAVVAAGSPMRRAIIAAMYAAAIVCLAMHLVLPAYSPSSPRPIDVDYAIDLGGAQWLVDGVTPELRKVSRFLLAPRELFPYAPSRLRVFSATAPLLPYPPPDAQVTRNGPNITISMRSMRAAPRLTLLFHAPDLAFVRVNGVRPPQQRPKFKAGLAVGWHSVSIRGASQATVEIVLKRDVPVDAILSDTTFGLPASALPLTRARDASIAVPTNTGDAVFVRRRLRF